MNFYQDMVEGLKGVIGPGKKYSNPTQLAKACGVAPNQIIRYIRQERGKHIQVVARVLDEIGAKIIFPDATKEPSQGSFKAIPEALARPDNTGKELSPREESAGVLAFSEDWVARKGNPESMRLVTVTGNAMSPRIEDGDSIIVDLSQKELYEGRIYAMRIDREVIVRRIAKEPGKIILVSDNSDLRQPSISLELSDESVGWDTLGRVVFIAKDLP
ncbi:S24 family peptidase [Maridesulfovibrio sp. FT414]|uniref:S24 family peptidase n=1 Tax=Maridesulfovibrio sp. FT414 TaxID=2979469 RepID=UPI003D804255